MESKEIRKRFLDFFAEKEHAIIPSAPVVPENDPSVLFTTAGMQPLVPYLLGEKHPQGTRLANFQKVIRTVDIDEVGDNTHLTFFEMMGNWSLGDYFKKEAVMWSYELLTDTEKGFGLDPTRLYVTCFAGDENAPKDTESAEIWMSLGVPEHRIYFLGADANWWPNVKKDEDGWSGPTGPSTEMFYDLTAEGLGDLSHEEFVVADDRQDVVEIWNDVFMEYQKKDGKVIGKLEQKNVDTGSGFERITTVLQGKTTVFETDIFMPIIEVIQNLSTEHNDASEKIIADHLRAAVFMALDGVVPSNKDQGYVMRRLIRRAVRHTIGLEMQEGGVEKIVTAIIDSLAYAYPDLTEKQAEITTIITNEEAKFRTTIHDGIKQFEKITKNHDSIDGAMAFSLFSTYGFPLELIREEAARHNIPLDETGFEEAMQVHQKTSKTASAGKFKGGLSSHGEMETKYHTATHLLHAALREVLGDHVMQKGSNITAERLRFDFSHDEKMTDEQKKAVEDWVNDKISRDIPMVREEMSYDEAKAKGAIGLFEDKYGDTVSVYSMVDGDGVVSRELCGGPHVERTGVLGTFSIKKEEASSAGVRRIKALLS